MPIVSLFYVDEGINPILIGVYSYKNKERMEKDYGLFCELNQLSSHTNHKSIVHSYLDKAVCKLIYQ